MRHFLLSRPVAGLTRGVREATGSTVLVACAGGAPSDATRGLRAAHAAVALTAITRAADHALAPTAGAMEEASSPIHRQDPCRRALDLRRSRRDTARSRASRMVGARHR